MSTRYNTGNPIESTDVRDMSDNAKNFDEFVNSASDEFTDRLGIERKTIHGMNSEFDSQILNVGFTRVGTFATGGTLTNGRQTLLWDVADGGDGQEYGWSGSFPLSGKVVPPGSTPLTTGGIAVGAWMSRFDPELRVQVREALRRSYAEAGYNLVNGSFEAGGTLVNANDVLLQEHTGKVFSGLAGPVAAGTDPASTGGTGVGAWSDKTDLTLRDGLANPDGSDLVGYKDSTVEKSLDTIFGEVSPLFQSHIKTLDYWAARMHAGEAVIITSFADSTGDGNGSTGWTPNPTTPVSGFPWATAPVANSDHNAEAPNAWPIKLQDILRQYHRNNNISVYNAGYSGQQMQNGWANYYFEKAVLQNPYIPSNPDIVIISFGLNDITGAGNKITEHITQTIEVMKKVIAAGATPVLTTCDANWRSYNGWNAGTSGRDNEEAAAQIDAAKKYMSEVLGVSIIDQDFMQKTWMSKNSDYSNQYQLQPDGLHWGDTGHSMKAAFVAQSFMPDILRCYGTDIERICWMDSRMRFSKDYTSSWVPPTGDEGFKYSRFPRIWYIQAADYTGSEVIFDFFVWSDGNQDSLIYRNFGNSNIGSAYAADQLPRVKVFSLGNTTAYYDKELPDTGEDEAYINATDRPFYLTKLRYGLNRIQVIAPTINTKGAFWGGWFEFNPFWKAKNTFGYFNNTGTPNYVQVNALDKIGSLDFTFQADTTNNRVAFMMPELFDGTNAADIGQVGDKVEILVEGFFDTDTGFLFFGGKSLNRGSGSTDDYQEDNCLLLYATSTTFNLLHLRYPYQSSAPFPQIQTGINEVYSPTDRNRKFLIRCEKTSPTTQTVKVYNGWSNVDTPVLNYAGDWSQGKFSGGGVVGGVYATRNINRTVRITQLMIRKYK